MNFIQLFLLGFAAIMTIMTILWVISVIIKDASIVDIFWGFGYVVAGAAYFYFSEGDFIRKAIVMTLVGIWGLRLTLYLGWRNIGKGEDFRYQKFRQDYGPERYWWFSFFQVYLLQGVIMWVVSLPLLGAMYFDNPFNFIDIVGIAVWTIGFIFETGGDIQLAVFKSKPKNKGKLMTTGFWHYTRHPNYFGDSAVWWGFGLLTIAGGCYIPVIGSLIMTFIIIKISGVSLLEQTLKKSKHGYEDYVAQTNAFFPWFPKRNSHKNVNK